VPSPILALGLILAATAVERCFEPCSAHVFISRNDRVGAYPAYPGQGWRGEAYLDLPDTAVNSLLSVESYLRTHSVVPDFTFRTPWIDFPAGEVSAAYDADLATIGDFLNDYIYDVSDPSKLASPMSHFFLRFKGVLKVILKDETRVRDFFGVPIWVDFGNMGYDGYRLTIAQLIYRTPDVNLNNNPWVSFGPNIEVQGLYPIEVTYFNRYDPDESLGAPLAGIELYSYHGGEKDYPAGEQMLHPIFGFGRITPPDVIYQPEDVLPLPKGDYDADADVDLADAQWMQSCSDPRYFFLPSGCDAFDYDNSGTISQSDIQAFLNVLQGPK